MWTDRQTNPRDEPTYLRFSQVIKEQEMAHSVGWYNVSEPGLRVFSSKYLIHCEWWPSKHDAKKSHIRFDPIYHKNYFS